MPAFRGRAKADVAPVRYRDNPVDNWSGLGRPRPFGSGPVGQSRMRKRACDCRPNCLIKASAGQLALTHYTISRRFGAWRRVSGTQSVGAGYPEARRTRACRSAAYCCSSLCSLLGMIRGGKLGESGGCNAPRRVDYRGARALEAASRLDLRGLAHAPHVLLICALKT